MKDFIDQFKGTSLDFDNVYEGQCVDLAKAWLDWIGYTVTGSWGNAINWDKRATSDLVWIANTPTGVPKEGDLIVWGMQPYGHIAVFIEGNSSRFTSFDQNYPVGSVCHIQEHNYSNVKGWLRPLKYQGANMLPENQLQGRLEIDSSGKVWWWTPSADWFHHKWNLVVARQERIIEKPVDREVIKEVIKEVEKVVEVKIPVEITRTIIEQVMVEKELTDEQSAVLDVWERIKGLLSKIRGLLSRNH